MNFRRQPFQFSSIDPVKRQAELQKRFGLPSDEMYVDCVSPGVMGAGAKESLINSSPRLQHRVPMFTDSATSAKSTGIGNNVDNGHQPRVRVVPIQVEGLNDASRRHRTFSGPTDTSFKNAEKSELKFDHQPKLVNVAANRNADQPRVCNIPIKIESNNKGNERELKRNETIIPTVIERKEQPPEDSTNGCNVSKTQEPCASHSLKQIENVLNNLKVYQVEVEKFTGTNKDKQYRYLDEMLTRCMLDLDNVDTLGIDNVRQYRKNAVKQVQACIDLLETKVTSQSSVVETTESVSISEIESANTDANVAQFDVEKNAADTEMKDCDSELVDGDVEMVKENFLEDTLASGQLTENCDIEMEDKSLEDHNAKIVVEESEECENLKEVKPVNGENTPAENQSSEFIEEEEMGKDMKKSPNDERLTIEEIEDSSEGVTSEVVIEEMCSDNDKSPHPERSEVNIEPVVIEHDSCELPDDVSNEQIPTNSSNESEQSGSSLDINKDEKITISEIPDKTVVIEECV